MTDFQEHSRMVDLSEYEQLRNEIMTRAQLSGALVGIQLTVLAAGLAVTNNFPDIVVALAGVSSILWLLWIDHSSQIFKIAAYIGLFLAPRLREGDAELLGWEHFMRIIDQGGQEATKALFGPSSSKKFKPLRTAVIGRFIFLLFGASPPLLIIGFIFVNFKQFSSGNSILWLHISILVLAFIVWIYACRQYWLFVKMRDTIGEALLQAPKMQIQEKQVHKSGSS